MWQPRQYHNNRAIRARNPAGGSVPKINPSRWQRAAVTTKYPDINAEANPVANARINQTTPPIEPNWR